MSSTSLLQSVACGVTEFFRRSEDGVCVGLAAVSRAASGRHLGGSRDPGILSQRWIEDSLETACRRRLGQPGRQSGAGFRFRCGLDQARGERAPALLRGKDGQDTLGVRLRRTLRRMVLCSGARGRSNGDADRGRRPDLHRGSERSHALPGREHRKGPLGEKDRAGISSSRNVVPAEHA